MNLQGAVVIVTGASMGIGRAAARQFAGEGARVALAARSAEALAALAAELPDSLAVPTDMRDEAAVRQMVAAVADHYGRIDVLVNNAGQGMHVPVAVADLALYRALLELNVVSVLAAMQAVIPIMRRQGGGVIVNVSSGTSKRIIPGVGPYASTKYALNALSLTARAELAPENIRVGVVYPGITATDFIRNAAAVQIDPARRQGMAADTAEHAAAKIVEAVRTEAAEVYADSIAPQ